MVENLLKGGLSVLTGISKLHLPPCREARGVEGVPTSPMIANVTSLIATIQYAT